MTVPINAMCSSLQGWADALQFAQNETDWQRVDHVRLNMLHCAAVLAFAQAVAAPDAPPTCGADPP
jgi:hypothetical protein